MNVFTHGTAPRLRAFVGATLSLFVGASLAQASDPAGGGIRVSGFGTFGVVHADAPAGWGYRRDTAQPANDGGTRVDLDSRLGLQLNYAPTPQFELVGQVLATRRSQYAANSDSVEWAFAAYRPRPDVALRVGRLNVDQFLMSDYRNVGFAYRFARPPVEFYGTLPTSLDGADIARDWNLAGALWRLKAYAGRVHSGDLSIDGGATQVRPVYGVMVSREADGLLLRAGLTHAEFAVAPPVLQPLLDGLSGLAALPVAEVAAQAAALRSRLDMAGTQITYATLAINYELHDWQWSGEFVRITGHPTVKLSAAYGGVARRFGPVTVFGGLSRIRSAAPVDAPAWAAPLTPVIGPAAAQQVQFLGTAAALAASMSSANQRALSLGARWDVLPRLALKFQWDRVHISAYGGRLWANPTADAGDADVSSVVLDFVF